MKLYKPSNETFSIRDEIDSFRSKFPGHPYCSLDQGDFIYFLVKFFKFKKCLQTGFGTGSTALYILSALGEEGSLISIDYSDKNFNFIGNQLIQFKNLSRFHSLIEEPSFLPVANFLIKNHEFDFIYIDGWKTFDYLAYEIFIFNRLLKVGGILMFDDAYLPSVSKIINFLKIHYSYVEIKNPYLNIKLYLYHFIVHRKVLRPYVALQKVLNISDQKPLKDWTYFEKF